MAFVPIGVNAPSNTQPDFNPSNPDGFGNVVNAGLNQIFVWIGGVEDVSIAEQLNGTTSEGFLRLRNPTQAELSSPGAYSAASDIQNIAYPYTNAYHAGQLAHIVLVPGNEIDFEGCYGSGYVPSPSEYANWFVQEADALRARYGVWVASVAPSVTQTGNYTPAAIGQAANVVTCHCYYLDYRADTYDNEQFGASWYTLAYAMVNSWGFTRPLYITEANSGLDPNTPGLTCNDFVTDPNEIATWMNHVKNHLYGNMVSGIAFFTTQSVNDPACAPNSNRPWHINQTQAQLIVQQAP